MNKLKTVNIGGVPEHFNLPWYLTLKEGAYKKEGINLRWKDYFGGTGQMCKALRNKDIDIAVILTEGIIKDIIDGNPSKIVQVYVKSPLIWGIHIANNAPFKTVNDLKGKKAGISRYGSGSHLMSYINAQNYNWDLEKDLDFKIVKNLEGAIKSITNGAADYFLWEKFTTKPLVDNNTFKRIGLCPSPWPCFVIAVREEFINEDKASLKTVLNIINKTTYDFKNIPSIDLTIANRYQQQLRDVKEWLSITHWSQQNISKETLENVQDQLLAVNIVPEKWEYSDLVTTL
jgi:ABC-type nitrate/sulfonate/bicarbonate transport system substrate-binding protein